MIGLELRLLMKMKRMGVKLVDLSGRKRSSRAKSSCNYQFHRAWNKQALYVIHKIVEDLDYFLEN